ncbi:DNApol-eta [Trypoxylus dichotomus]
MESQNTERVVVLVDMDCFYCQVEEKLNPSLFGKPIAVVQYNAWKGGGIIAVNYPARDKGVTRHMRGDEAKAKCPDIKLVRVPTLREKADLTKYRDAGKEVAAVLQTYTDLLERASVDEAYMDITSAVNERIACKHPITLDQLKNSHVVGYDIKDFVDSFKYEYHLESNFKLCVGGIIAEEVRAAVFRRTGYRCSAGIAHNKVLAKLACGLHKPNQQTILPQDGVAGLFETLPLRKIRSLGGKFGYNLGEDLNIKTMGELKQFSEKELINRYDEKTGSWLYKIARGIDLEPVTVRLVSKSIGCCKKFPGRTALVTPEDVQHWVGELSNEISERLNKDFEENNRKAKHMVIGFVNEINKRDVSASRTHPLNSYDPEKVAADMLKVVNKHCLNADGFYRIKYLGISAGKFEDCKKTYTISSYFSTCDKETNTEDTKPEYSLSYFFSKMKNTNVAESNINSINLEKLPDDVDNQNETAHQVTKEIDLDAIYAEDTVIMDFPKIDCNLTENERNTEASFSNTLMVVRRENKDSETDSITDEIDAIGEDINVSKANTSSFFSNYFNNIEHHSRDFDTSKYLEDNDSNIETETASTESSSERTKSESNFDKDERSLSVNNFDNKSTDIQAAVTDNANFAGNNEINDETKERCKECNKLISKADMASHKDYHFALQIVRDEAHLYTNQSNITVTNAHKKTAESGKESKPKKRKRCEVTSAKLTAFLESTSPVSTDVVTQVCQHCNKKIAIDELACHLDYHVAKKLQAEINDDGVNNPIKIPVTKSTAKVRQRTKKKNKLQSVISFFKHDAAA